VRLRVRLRVRLLVGLLTAVKLLAKIHSILGIDADRKVTILTFKIGYSRLDIQD
jgi:hypothetical protein